MQTAVRKRLEFLSVLKQHNYRRYWIGLVTSVTSHQALITAQGWLVYDITGEELALGLLITNEFPINSFLKSTIEPLIIFKELLSIIVFSKILSSGLILSSKEKLYLKPEHPPPFTDILK